MVQEHHLHGHALLSAQEWAIKRGWKSFLTPSIPSDGGHYRAGARVFVRSHIWTTVLGDFLADHTLVDGYAVAIFIQRGPRHGFLAVSMYLEQGEQLGRRNTARLKQLGRCLSFYNVLLIVGAYWDVGPDVLNKSGLVDRLRARLIVP
eukprot:4754188-Pyramimonas_sp.AAC.2